MFAELAISAAFGFVKGLNMRGRGRRSHSPAGAHFAGPIFEEVLFRGLLPPAAGLAGFVAVHRPKTLTRAADVALGGVLYASAYKRAGLFGAIAAHVAHNVAIDLGVAAR